MEQVNEQDLAYRGGESGVKYLLRGPNIDWGRLRLKPGETLGHHYHDRVEETFYFLEGEPLMVVNGEKIRVRRGDAFRLEPHDTHDIINDTDDTVETVFIKSTYDPKDKVNVE